MRPPEADRREVRRPSHPGVRPRYGRMAAAGLSLLLMLVSVLGGLGVLPTEEATAESRDASREHSSASTDPSEGTTPSEDLPDDAVALAGGVYNPESESARTPALEPAPAIPAHSGTGRRVVFDMSAQRVWLVGQQAGRDVVRRTYRVSGSVTDNLQPGSYRVYSRSLRAWGIDDSGSMRYMVRFAHGDNAAIGFHDIPVLDGAYVQTREQLGTPQSHGCIRQWRPDAQALWAFAPLDTTVVVV